MGFFGTFLPGLAAGAAAAPSNPFAERTLGTDVKQQAQELRDDTRDRLKQLTI